MIFPNCNRKEPVRRLKPSYRLLCARKLLCLEGVGRAGGDVGGVYAGGGILVVHIECPVLAVLIVVHGDAVDGLDIQAVLAVLARDQAKGQQRRADGLLIGVETTAEASAVVAGAVLSFLLHPTVESANAAISAMHRRMDSSFFMLNLFITILLSCYSFPACLETAA